MLVGNACELSPVEQAIQTQPPLSADVALPTALVVTVNVPVVEPAGIVTDVGTVTPELFEERLTTVDEL
jgi:hypothetical protein